MITCIMLSCSTKDQTSTAEEDVFQVNNIILQMNRVNDHFRRHEKKHVDRNWIRATYYTGLMAFFNATGDSSLHKQAYQWGARHGWRVGTEWVYPANRLTSSQTYLELYFADTNPIYIKRTRRFMDRRLKKDRPAFDAGWFYADALYVGTPAFIMMTRVTNDQRYAAYGHRMFREVADSLFDTDENLFFRDLKAKKKRDSDGNLVFWSRGNGWAFAALPRIIDHLTEGDTAREFYESIFLLMAESLLNCQQEDGLWRTHLTNPVMYRAPESSGSAFFTYGMAWGIRKGLLDHETYLPAVMKAWTALYNLVDENGKVTWGQKVARSPGKVRAADSDEFVAGAFLLAGSEMIRLVGSGSLLQFDEMTGRNEYSSE